MYFILRCGWHKMKGVRQHVCIFSNCTDCSVLDVHLFRYKSTTFQCLLCCTDCSHNFLSTAYKETPPWDKADLYFTKYTIFQTETTELNYVYVLCENQFFIWYFTFEKSVVKHCVPCIILIWYNAELISLAHYNVHFQHSFHCICH
jgi:hypothetical protein